MNWADFAREAPELARLAEERFEATGLCLIGTIRRDGTPRISPIEPLIAHSHLYLGMMWQSQKALDLLRDPRCLVHSTVSNKDGTEGEVKLRGRVLEVPDPAERERFGLALFEKTGWRPPGPYHLFALDIQDAAFVKFSSDGDQTVMRWRAGGAVQSHVRKWTGSGYAD